jgi:biopolymer transport protein ExbB
MRFTTTFRHALLGLLAVCAFAATPALAQTSEAAKPAPAPVAEMAKPAKEVVENPYGIEALWAQGDFVSKGTLIILAIMSMGSWYIGIVKLLEQTRLLKEGKEARQQFWQAPTIEEGSRTLGEDSAFRFLAEEGIKAATPTMAP